MLDVRREEDAVDILGVGFEMGDGHELRFFAVLEEVPDEDGSLVSISRRGKEREGSEVQN